jgi:hypothetical protein
LRTRLEKRRSVDIRNAQVAEVIENFARLLKGEIAIELQAVRGAGYPFHVGVVRASRLGCDRTGETPVALRQLQCLRREAELFAKREQFLDGLLGGGVPGGGAAREFQHDGLLQVPVRVLHFGEVQPDRQRHDQ